MNRTTAAAATAALTAGASANALDLDLGGQKVQFHDFGSQGFIASSE